jgi:hypothetical protein
MNINNNNNAPRGRGNKRARAGGASGQDAGPQQKKRKTSNRQRKRRAKMGRAAAEFALEERDLAGKGRTGNGTTNRKSFVVTEDEYIGEIAAANEPAFNVNQFPVNPGLAQTFPWLSTIAKNFEKYQFEYLEFYYKREVSEFATAGQSGKVLYSFDTDAADPVPYGKQEMEATEPHGDDMPCKNFRMVVPRSMLQPIRTDAHFVRAGAAPPNTDIKTYDIGALNVATQGTAANGIVGELHVRYRVRLMVPIIPVGGPTNVGTLASSTAGIAAATPFGSAPTAQGGLSLSAALQVLTVGNVQVGQEISVASSVLGTTVTGYSVGTTTGLTNKTVYAENMVSGTTIAGLFLTFTVTALNPTLTLTPSAAALTSSQTVVSVLAPAPGF